MRIGRSPSTLAVLLATSTITGCAAVKLPRAAALPSARAPIPVNVMVCPDAERTAGRLLDDNLFARIDLASDHVASAPTPDLVIVAGTSHYRRGMHEKPVPLSTRLTEPFSLLTLGVLPTYVPHRGEATLTFRRPTSANAPCAESAAGAPTLLVSATPVVREFIAFWAFFPALIATLPGWSFAGGDGLESPAIDPTAWLPAALYEHRVEIVDLARR